MPLGDPRNWVLVLKLNSPEKLLDFMPCS